MKIHLKRSKWNQNPYVCGSYAHIRLGSTDEDVKSLAEPLVSKDLLTEIVLRVCSK